LINNMEILGIDPLSIQAVFISHPHHDHTGGLPLFLEKNSNVKVWIPSCMDKRLSAREVITISKPTFLQEGIYSTGELEGIEQSMVVETNRGFVLMTGCSHPPMEKIRASASQFGKVYGIVGGLHGTLPESLIGLNLICASHCTQQKEEIARLYPEAFIPGGAGRVIEVE